MADLGQLTIHNDGTQEEPGYSLHAEIGGFLFDSISLDTIAKGIHALKEDHGHTWNSIVLEIEPK